MARKTAKKTTGGAKTKRNAATVRRVDRQGITNAPPQREREEQAALPPRGGRKGRAHA